MRKLTVTRRKTFVGCIAKIKLYIEDEIGEETIGETKCRFLGELKNNESATFEIGNESYKLIAVYDKLTKNYCNDCYTISAGEENVEVAGIAHFNPFCGNPFYFDGVTDPEVLARRKSNSKKALLIAVPLMIAFAVGGFFLGRYLTGLFI